MQFHCIIKKKQKLIDNFFCQACNPDIELAEGNKNICLGFLLEWLVGLWCLKPPFN